MARDADFICTHELEAPLSGGLVAWCPTCKAFRHVEPKASVETPEHLRVSGRTPAEDHEDALRMDAERFSYGLQYIVMDDVENELARVRGGDSRPPTNDYEGLIGGAALLILQAARLKTGGAT
jgi:hypothetical protein